MKPGPGVNIPFVAKQFMHSIAHFGKIVADRDYDPDPSLQDGPLRRSPEAIAFQAALVDACKNLDYSDLLQTKPFLELLKLSIEEAIEERKGRTHPPG